MIIKINKSTTEIEIIKENDLETMGRADMIIHTRPGGQKMAIIEDVFTEPQFRGQGVASEIIEEAILTAKAQNCYKIVLMCNDDNVLFYNKFGFVKRDNAMRLNFVQ